MESRNNKRYDSFDDFVDFDKGNNELKEKATALKHSVRSFELRLKGYKWSSDGSKFINTGEVLAGNHVIQKAISLLQAFSEDANIITNKSDKTFSKQKYRVCSTMNNTLLVEGTSYAENYNVIMQEFTDTLQNIGDIILGSKDLLKYQFGMQDKEDYKGDAI